MDIGILKLNSHFIVYYLIRSAPNLIKNQNKSRAVSSRYVLEKWDNFRYVTQEYQLLFTATCFTSSLLQCFTPEVKLDLKSARQKKKRSLFSKDQELARHRRKCYGATWREKESPTVLPGGKLLKVKICMGGRDSLLLLLHFFGFLHN